MRASSWMAAAAGIAFLAATSAPGSLVPPGPAPKPGLWEVHFSTNMALFIVNPRGTTEERKRMSDEYLRRSSVSRVCETEEQHKAFVEKTMGMGGCSPEGVRKSERMLTLDMVCKDKDKVHAEFTIDPDAHQATGLVETVMDGATGMPKAHVEARFASDHVSLVATASGPATPDVPLINKYDLSWVSADCGNTPAGKAEPAPAH